MDTIDTGNNVELMRIYNEAKRSKYFFGTSEMKP